MKKSTTLITTFFLLCVLSSQRANTDITNKIHEIVYIKDKKERALVIKFLDSLAIITRDLKANKSKSRRNIRELKKYTTELKIQDSILKRRQ